MTTTKLEESSVVINSGNNEPEISKDSGNESDKDCFFKKATNLGKCFFRFMFFVVIILCVVLMFINEIRKGKTSDGENGTTIDLNKFILIMKNLNNTLNSFIQ